MCYNVDTEVHCVKYGFHVLKYGRMLRQKLQDLECVLRDIILIQRDDILSMEYLKKTAFTGCDQGMRYRLEGVAGEDSEKRLRCTIWPEPFNFYATSEEEKETAEFAFEEDGVTEAVAWMNERLTAERSRWAHAEDHWDSRR